MKKLNVPFKKLVHSKFTLVIILLIFGILLFVIRNTPEKTEGLLYYAQVSIIPMGLAFISIYFGCKKRM